MFDGGSFVVDAEGALLARAPQFVEDLMIVDVPYEQVDRIREIVAARHPEVVLSAQETRYPAFP